jgi:hypothetical protein
MKFFSRASRADRVSLAAEGDMTAGELAMQSVGQFVGSASDEHWLTLIGQISHAENPSMVFLRCAPAHAVPT